MNLVEEIKKMISGEVLAKLSSLIGASESQTSSTVAAAIPAMLSGVSNLASSESGLGKLASALGGLNTSGLGNPAQMLGGANVGKMGTELLGSLFGNSILGSLGGLLGKVSGIGSGGISGLLGLLAPLVLGSVAKSWTAGGGGAAGLKSLLDGQKSNIQAALPQGFNLGDTFKSVASAAPAAPSGGGLGKLIPVIVGLLALGGIAWYVLTQMGKDPATVPGDPSRSSAGTTQPVGAGDATKATESFTKFFEGLGGTLKGVTDVKSADEAITKLKTMDGEVDGLKGMLDKLPAVGKEGIVTMIKDRLKGLTDMVKTALAIPGVGDKLKPVIEPLMAKLTGLAG
jgi:hypothetical protein